ncbi:Imm1 family immunity protein [Saccharopolyspora pogona]|uniref:Imm1 family immunity protein n=1 Tax=Saccharopolyspora pogona TaxID=333966 RepID=UPI0037C675AA
MTWRSPIRSCQGGNRCWSRYALWASVASASLRLEQVREAIAEYCRTGVRPTCVQWQPGKWY